MTLPVPIDEPADDGGHEMPTSALLIALVEAWPEADIPVGALSAQLGERAFGLLLLILSLPTALPGPPGLPIIFAGPMLFVALQLCLGRRQLWLPGFLGRRTVSRRALLALLRRVEPVLSRIERLCRARLPRLSAGTGERVTGAFLALGALVLLNPVPVPFSHLPLGMALALLALGYAEGDGVVIALGIAATLGGIAFNISLTGGLLLLLFDSLRFLVS